MNIRNFVPKWMRYRIGDCLRPPLDFRIGFADPGHKGWIVIVYLPLFFAPRMKSKKTYDFGSQVGPCWIALLCAVGTGPFRSWFDVLKVPVGERSGRQKDLPA